jgi:trehalose-6-phosphate synthase
LPTLYRRGGCYTSVITFESIFKLQNINYSISDHRYIFGSVNQQELAAYYRDADVALITPLRDGMNLVAKEFVACQDDNDPGVLVLSPFAGILV